MASEGGSPDVPKIPITVLYAENPSSEDGLERKDLELKPDLENEDNITVMYAENPSSEDGLEREDLELKPDLENEDNRIKGVMESEAGAVTDVTLDKVIMENNSELGAPSTSGINSHFTRYDSKPNASNVSKISSFSVPRQPTVDKSKRALLLSLLHQLSNKKCMPSFMLKTLKKHCYKVKDFRSLLAFSKHLLYALKRPVKGSVPTQSHNVAKKPDAQSLLSKNISLQNKQKIMSIEIESLKNKLNKKEQQIKRSTNEEVQTYFYTEAKIENDKLKKKICSKEKEYARLRKLLKEKNKDVRKADSMFHSMVKQADAEKANGCDKCRKLKRKVKDLKTCNIYSAEHLNQLNHCKQDLVNKEELARNKVNKLLKEREEVEHQLRMKDTNMMKRREDANPKSTGLLGEPFLIRSHNEQDKKKAYDEPSTSNSVFFDHNIPCSSSQADKIEEILSQEKKTQKKTESNYKESDACGDESIHGDSISSKDDRKL